MCLLRKAGRGDGTPHTTKVSQYCRTQHCDRLPSYDRQCFRSSSGWGARQGPDPSLISILMAISKHLLHSTYDPDLIRPKAPTHTLSVAAEARHPIPFNLTENGGGAR